MSESGQMRPGNDRLHPGSTPGQDDARGAGTEPAKRKRSRKRRRPKNAGSIQAGVSGQGAGRAAGDRDADGQAADVPIKGGADSKTASAGSRKRSRKRHRPNRAERRAGAARTDGHSTAEAQPPASGPQPTAGRPGEVVRAARAQAGDTNERRSRPISDCEKAVRPAAARAPGTEPVGRDRREVAASGHGSPCASGSPRHVSRDVPDVSDEAQGRLYAALDLGTNNCRLLVARPEQRGFRVVDAYSRIVRLGEGLGHTNRLSDAAMERAMEALACCRDKLEDRGVERFRLIATEACRAAENGPQFIERVRQETGLALEIASRETEARLAVAGCASLVCPDANGVVLFDIGGGSSEIVWLDLRNRCGARGVALTRFIRAWISLPVGVVNLAERHGGRHVTADTFEAMVNDARAHLEAFTLGRELSAAICDGKVHMLGTSGTVTTLAGVHFGLKRYDRRRVDGAWMDNEDVTAMIERLRAMPYEERVDNPCIGADRADLVLAGCAILEAIRRRWPCQRLRVADRGLREGILMELMAADNVWRRKPPHRQRPRGRTR